METFKELVLLNTIENHSNTDGITFYDLTQIDPHIPYSRIYRFMNKLEETGILRKKEEDVGIPGRPKQYFSLTEAGKRRHEELKQTIRTMFLILKERLEGDLEDIDFRQLHMGKFTRFNPIEKILESNDSNQEKLENLLELEEDFKNKLKRITEAKEQLSRQE